MGGNASRACRVLRGVLPRELSRWIRFESFGPLSVTNKCGDGRDVLIGQPCDRFHGTEAPMVLSAADLDGQEKGSIAVMVWPIDRRQMRWAPIGAAEVYTVTGCAGRLVDRFTCHDQFGILGRDGNVGRIRGATSEQ